MPWDFKNSHTRLISACNYAPVNFKPQRSGAGRLQKSPYFCVFKYARAVKQKVWNEAENRERDWGETLKIRFFSLASHALRGHARLAALACVRLLRHALPILRKKPTVLQSMGPAYPAGFDDLAYFHVKFKVNHALPWLPLTLACTLAGIYRFCSQSLMQRSKMFGSLKIWPSGLTFHINQAKRKLSRVDENVCMRLSA